MGYLGRRIGLSQDNGDSNPGAAGGAVGGGLLDLFAHGYFEQQGDIYNAPGAPSSGLTATGGVISDYTDSGSVYRAHIFTSTGTFDVTAPGDFGDTVDILAVGSGGGGGTSGGGGGGGGVRYLTAQPIGASFPQPFAITIGAGGLGQQVGGSPTPGASGNSSSIGSSPQPINITSPGGGGGGSHTVAGAAGASGGGTGRDVSTAGASATGSAHPGVSNVDVPSAPNPAPAAWFGHAGGQGPSTTGGTESAGGGGGAAAAGNRAKANGDAAGGAGAIYTIANGAQAKYGAGGGGGGYNNGTGGVAGASGYSPFDNGGGDGGQYLSPTIDATSGEATFGQGGGGGRGPGGPGSGPGGSGGSGVIVVRYKIGSIATAKATGGAISFYSGKTIHTFTNSGTFATTSDWSAGNVEYVVVGGGGGSNTEDLGGAGGAGGFITGTTPIGSHPVSTTIQVGAGGIFSLREDRAGGSGTPSYFGTPLTGYGGGGGAGKTSDPLADAIPGGSGGGGDHGPNPGAPGDKQTGTSSAAPITPQGYPGGDGASPYGTGGGGGAGGAGGDGANPYIGGAGGLGRQSPSTFRDPISTLGAPGPTGSVPGTNPGGDTSGKFWFAGGGGGGVDSGTNGGGGGGAAAGASFAGGGYGGHYPGLQGTDGTEFTGGGGGATDNGSQSIPVLRGKGGSGIVLVAYPS